jgi:hypothetical protein
VVRAASQALRAAPLVLAAALAVGCSGDRSVHQRATAPAKGTLDTSYALDGRIQIFGSRDDIAVAPDGTVYAVTFFSEVVKVAPSGVVLGSIPLAADRVAANDTGFVAVKGGVVSRFDLNMQPVAAFGSNGVASIELVRFEAPVQVLLNPDGEIYVIGVDGEGRTIWVRKLDANGRPVASFGDAGRLVVLRLEGQGPIGFAGESINSPKGTLDPLGNLFVSISIFNDEPTFIVGKVDREGRLAPGFSDRGIWRGPRPKCFSRDIAADADGNVFVGGNCAGPDGIYRAAVAKLDWRGALVPDFGSGGVAEGVFAAAGLARHAGKLAVGTDGTVYVVAFNEFCFGVLTALDSRGRPIESFGTRGRIEDVSQVALDEANRIYTATTHSCNQSTFTVSRYN